jgi:hypothetical protein
MLNSAGSSQLQNCLLRYVQQQREIKPFFRLHKARPSQHDAPIPPRGAAKHTRRESTVNQISTWDLQATSQVFTGDRVLHKL